jgi:hypothetical protein
VGGHSLYEALHRNRAAQGTYVSHAQAELHHHSNMTYYIPPGTTACTVAKQQNEHQAHVEPRILIAPWEACEEFA